VLDNFYAGEGDWAHYGGIWTYHQPTGVDENSSLKADAEGIDLSSTFIPAGEQYGSNGGDLLVEGEDYSLLYLAQIMINNSHNWATNRLIDYLATDEATGMDRVNAELDLLGLDKIRIQRYQSGTDAPSAHGTTGSIGDYMAGYDNIATPRQMASFYQQVYENDGLLSNALYDAFFDILSDSVKGYAPSFLAEGVDADWQDIVTLYNKAGSMDFNGPLGTYTHKPQLASHDQATEAGLFEFADGQIVVFAMFIDELDPEAGGNAIRCAAYEVVTEYSGVSTGDVPDACE
jgi:hypothetical protein